MKFNPAIITNIGFIIVFATLIMDKVNNGFFSNVFITGAYVVGASLVIIGTIGYFMRK